MIDEQEHLDSLTGREIRLYNRLNLAQMNAKKVKDSFFGGAEKRAGKKAARAQEAAGRLSAAQLKQTEEEFAPFNRQLLQDCRNHQDSALFVSVSKGHF
jgi:hypothetical protein